jgi:hypothetical protein
MQILFKKCTQEKEEKKKQGARTKVQASKQPKRDRQQEGNGTTKYRNLHQSLETYQLKKRKVNLIKLHT